MARVAARGEAVGVQVEEALPRLHRLRYPRMRLRSPLHRLRLQAHRQRRRLQTRPAHPPLLVTLGRNRAVSSPHGAVMSLPAHPLLS